MKTKTTGKLIRFYGLPATLTEWTVVVMKTVKKKSSEIKIHETKYGPRNYIETVLTDADRDKLMTAWRDGWNCRLSFKEM